MEKVLKRAEVPREDTWAIEDLYESNEACREDMKEMEALIERFTSYQGRLAESKETLKEALDAYAEMNRRFERMYVYASQKLHEDMGNGAQQKLSKEADSLANRLSAACSYLEPEILKIPEEALKQWMAETEGLKPYGYFLKNILDGKAHTLDEETEALLARARELAQASGDIFGMFNNADVRFSDVITSEGEKLPLTAGRYGGYLQSADRNLRRQAFQNLYAVYRQFSNTLAAAYDANARQAAFFAKEHRYPSAREAALDANHIPLSVYDNLVETVNERLPLLHRYMDIRKKALGYEELHMYDLYVPMVGDVQQKYSFEEAKKIVLEGLAPLGEDYLEILREGFSNRWIDVYENEGKRTGAYSWGAYGVHPYVLLNYQGELNDVFTLAHEMGHSLHSYHSDKHQPYIYAGYSIFVAEVASTVNEALLIQYLLKNTQDRQEKAYLVNYFLEQFRTTLYRQTMFAEFERESHKIVGEGGSLTAESLSSLYGDLNRKYFGEGVICDEEISYEWSRIPHFYTPFYVYQYSTGFSAAIAISSKILKGEPGSVENYKKFLSGGSSMTPIELLRLCGVDMESPAPVREALNVFEEYLGEMEKLL